MRLGGLHWESAKAPPAGPGGARQPNVLWCILGVILHLFECLNDEEFPVIRSPVEGRFHSIDVISRCGHFLRPEMMNDKFTSSLMTLIDAHCIARPPAGGVGVWGPRPPLGSATGCHIRY